MTSFPLTSFVTLLVVLLQLFTGFNVARARGRYGIMAPAVTGHEMFERAFRIQMNTLENAVLMLPALWMFAGFVDDRGAAILGGLWIAARVWYAVAYQNDPKKRGPGFGIAMLSFIGLWLGALWGILQVVVH